MISRTTSAVMSVPAPDAVSSAVRARRASPPAKRTNRSVASGEMVTPGRPSGWASARAITRSTSSSVRACRTSSIDRDSSGLTMLMLGFSVVAAIRVTQPCSTAGSRTSCWVLEKRWTSSMNRMVRSPWVRPRSRASSMAARTSFTPALTAANATKRRPLTSAARRASVVLPVPGGPHKITLVAASGSLSRARNGEFGPSKWDCPMTSSTPTGRTRAASGATGALSSNRSATTRRPPRGRSPRRPRHAARP